MLSDFVRIVGTALLFVSLNPARMAFAQVNPPYTNAPVEVFDSPRITALARQIKAGSREALVGFWEEMKGRAPLVESIPGNSMYRWVTFLWRGDKETRTVAMFGGLGMMGAPEAGPRRQARP